jgi:hypothetical protein
MNFISFIKKKKKLLYNIQLPNLIFFFYLKMKYAILYDQNASISSYQEGRIGIPSTGLTPPQGVCLSQARIWIFIVIYRGVFCIQ